MAGEGYPPVRGMSNYDNNCFLNSVLQVLFTLEDFRQHVCVAYTASTSNTHSHQPGNRSCKSKWSQVVKKGLTKRVSELKIKKIPSYPEKSSGKST